MAGEQLRGRAPTFGLLAAVFSGLVVLGLLLPYLAGSPVDDQSSTVAGALPEIDPGSEVATTSTTAATSTPEVAGGPAGRIGTRSGGPSGSTTGGGGDGGGAGSPAVAGGGDVRIGFLLLDLGGASRVGFGSGGLANAEQQRQIFDAYVAEWNDQGGINGRRIVPAYAAFDPLSNDSKHAACLALTEDTPTFAVVDGSGGFYGASVLCFTEAHQTPLFTGAGLNATSAEIQRRSEGRLFGLSMSGPRMLANAARIWHEQGLLKGKTIGILDWDELGNPETVDAGLIATLKDLGYSVEERIVLAADPGTAAGQIPLAVQEMRTAGVDLVVNATQGLYMAQFSQAADSQGYRPSYVASDWALNGTDFTAQNNSPGYDGTPLVTVFRGNDIGRLPISGPERRCEEIYRKRIGPPPPRDPANPNAWVGFAVRCAVLEYFVLGARAAGDELTHQTLAAGMASLGSLEVALFTPGAFRPGKPDMADNYFLQRWTFSCRCYRVVSGPHPAPLR